MERGWDRDDVSEARRIGARHAVQSAGGMRHAPSLGVLVRILQREGPDPALLDSALHLPLDQFNTFEGRFKQAPAKPLPKIRRRK